MRGEGRVESGERRREKGADSKGERWTFNSLTRMLVKPSDN